MLKSNLNQSQTYLIRKGTVTSTVYKRKASTVRASMPSTELAALLRELEAQNNRRYKIYSNEHSIQEKGINCSC